MRIPSKKEIKALYKEFQTPRNVILHSKKVCEAASIIAEKFLEKGIKVNLKLIEAGALLHDLARPVDFRIFDEEKYGKVLINLRRKYKNMHHADVASLILDERNFPEVAKLVKKHRFLQIQKGFKTWEEKILYYADKRVEYGQIVPLKERLEKGRTRNVPEKAWDRESMELDKKVFLLEDELKKILGNL